MNEQTLINMLSELDAGSLKENFTEKDLRSREGNIFKRAYFYIKSQSWKEEADSSILMNHLEEYREEVEEAPFSEASKLKAAENIEEEEESTSQRGFSIHVFKRSIKNIVRMITAIIAALFVILGLIIVIFKRKQGIKFRAKKIQISY